MNGASILIVIVGIVLFGALAGHTKAQQSAPLVEVLGLGRGSCGRFLDAVADEHRMRLPGSKPEEVYTREYGGYVNYALGFLTAINWASRLVRPDIPQGEMHDNFVGETVWLENYCRQHPLDSYFTALEHLSAALVTKAQSETRR